MYDKIRSGEKRQTIRPAEQYRHLHIGDKVHCYSTKRKKGVRRPVTNELLCRGFCVEIIVKTWKRIKNDEKTAKLDGFANAEEMREWFQKKYQRLPDHKLLRIIKWFKT
jgi:hypothetical protein